MANIRAAMADGARRVLFQLPTGGGKTVVFAHIARSAAMRNKRVCILVHRWELLRQASEKLDHPHGLITPRCAATPSEPIQIASVQSLARRIDRWRNAFDLIVVDEAHHTTANTYTTILQANPRAHVLGVTATPCRLTGRGLGDEYDVLLTGPSIADLIRDGHLAQPRVYAPSVADITGVHTRAGDYITAELEQALDEPKLVGDAIKHYRRLAHKKPAVAFCWSVDHAHRVAERFAAAGYTAHPVDGKTDARTRDDRIDGLATGTVDVITSCSLIDEGLDIPVVECAIDLTPTRSLTRYMQRCGRVLRPSPGKQHAIILDHAGNTLRHGFLDADRDWALDKGAITPQTDSDPSARIRQCDQCYYVHRPAPVCPECGHVYQVNVREIEEKDGELVELTPEMMAKKQARREVGRARTIDELREIAKQRGYKPGWAEHVHRARQRRQQICQSLA